VLRENFEGWRDRWQAGESAYHDDKNWKSTFEFRHPFARRSLVDVFNRGHGATDKRGIDGERRARLGRGPWGLVSGHRLA